MKLDKLWKQIFQYTLAAVVIVGTFWLFYLLLIHTVPEGNRDALLVVLGVLTGAFASIVNYFFGSSKGSADKTEIMNGGPK